MTEPCLFTVATSAPSRTMAQHGPQLARSQANIFFVSPRRPGEDRDAVTTDGYGVSVTAAGEPPASTGRPPFADASSALR